MFGGYVSKILEGTSPPYGLLLLALGTVFIAQIVRTLAWRLWLHPLASIPGPRLAAVSGLWQMRQDLFLENSARAIDQLHREYNTDIVRISPNHVHINDPDFFFKIFSIGSGFDKDPSFYGRLGVPRSILSADSRSARSMRSKANAIVAPRDWGVMAEKAYLATRLASDELAILSKKGEEIDFFQMLRSISTDILCQLSYGFSPGFVDKPEEAKKLFDVLDMCLESLWFLVHMPFLSEYLFSLPKWLLKILLPAFTYFRNLGGGWIDQTLENSKNAHPNDKKTTVMDALNPSKDHILTEADREWLIDQGNTFLFAGVDTTSTMLMFTFHKVLSSPNIHGRLKEELRNANLSIEEKYDWRRVRQLPYLTAVIKEGLRLSLVIPGRLPRLVPADGIEYNGIFLPGGTSVSSTIYSMHHNPTIFPDPCRFNPDRWLAENSIEIERYNVAFSKGSRSCIGMNLAYLEIYTTMALFFSRFDMILDYPAPGKELEWTDCLARRSKDFIKVRITADKFSS